MDYFGLFKLTRVTLRTLKHSKGVMHLAKSISAPLAGLFVSGMVEEATEELVGELFKEK